MNLNLLFVRNNMKEAISVGCKHYFTLQFGQFLIVRLQHCYIEISAPLSTTFSTFPPHTVSCSSFFLSILRYLIIIELMVTSLFCLR